MKTKLRQFVLGILCIVSANLYSQNKDAVLIDSLFEECDLSFQNLEYEKSRDLAEEILEIENSNCNTYMILGEIYSSVPKAYLAEIMNKAEEYNMIYCLAVDMFIKAKEVDSLCMELADKEIAFYSEYFPSSHFGINNEMIGNEYKINGWINRMTTIRFREE